MTTERELDSGVHVCHKHCIANEVIGKRGCASSDALDIREHDNREDGLWYDAYCWSCDQYFSESDLKSSSLADELGVDTSGTTTGVKSRFVKKEKQKPMTKEEVLTLIKDKGYESGGYRGISKESSKFFGHLTSVDNEGRVLARYYPETSDGIVTGYKIRMHPKRFSKVGATGKVSDLSGQVKFSGTGGKYILLVGGEEDLVAAYEMLAESQKARGQGEFTPIPVVSPTIGESGAYKQVAAQYEFLDMYDNIVIGMDNDEAGREAAKKIAEVLPKEKVKIALWSAKDPNKMLQLNMGRQFIRDFYSAKDLVSSGLIESSELDLMVEKELLVEKIPLPPFMSKLEDMMAGGVPLGYIINITAGTGVGKTTIVNEMLYYWIFNSPHKMGVVSLELTAAQYGVAMLSRHLGRKLSLFKNGQDAVDFINTPTALEKRQELWQDDSGASRWVLLDEREGTLSELERQCEMLFKKHECKFIVLDPLQDILDGHTIEEQSLFMKWEKQMVKSGVTFININHIRKGGSQQKDSNGNTSMRELVDDDIHGTSAIAKSGGANIYAMRDTMSSDEDVKNTTRVTTSKIRWTGMSGECGKWYYDRSTHRLHDFDSYFGSK